MTNWCWHRRAQEREVCQGARHAHLLTRGAEIKPGSPVEPVGTGAEPVVPPFLLVELSDKNQELRGRGLDTGRELSNSVSEAFGGGHFPS